MSEPTGLREPALDVSRRRKPSGNYSPITELLEEMYGERATLPR